MKAWTKNLREIFDKSKQSIEVNKSEHPTVTLDMNFQKPAGESKTYVRFGYSPRKIFLRTRGQVSGSMNADPIHENQRVNNELRKYDN